MNDQNSDDVLIPKWLTIFIAGTLSTALLIVPLWFLFIIGIEELVSLIKTNPQFFLGIPWAGGMAFMIVVVFKPIFGDIKFKVIGFNFEGASGPVILWIMCFLAEIAAIRTLWPC